MDPTGKCYVYIMASNKNRVLYVGTTHDIVRRVYEHKHKIYDGFTKEYNVDKLVFFVEFEQTVDAILCEKKFKKLSRANKEKLILKNNPKWRDLSEDFV